MMRFQSTSTLVLAGIVGIPAVASQQDGSLESLESALKSTQAAIVEVMGLQEKLATKDPEALARLEQLTEHPVGSTSETVNHIIVLQREIDNLRRSESQQIAGTSPLSQVRSASPAKTSHATPIGIPSVPTHSPPEIHGLKRPVQSVAIEQEGYSLDDIRQGKLLVRAGKAEQAVRLLEGKKGNSEGSYWLARALQDLGDIDGAVALYTTIAEDDEAGVFQAWAKQEIAMVDLRKRLKGTTRSEAAPK